MTSPSLAAVPTDPVKMPIAVASVAHGDTIEPVWRNEAGGLTFRLTSAHGEVRYMKFAAAGSPETDLTSEVERLQWAARYSPVPEVLDAGTGAGGNWIVTRGIMAKSAVDEPWLRHPEVAVKAMGRGLRAMHDALPIDDCPFHWSISERLGRAEMRNDPRLAEVRRRLAAAPQIGRLVVCHGDACAPNTLLDENGDFAAHVDLGRLGVADRWADIAIGAWSTEWNFGPGWEPHYYEAYGVEPDLERVAYYRLLWDLS